MDTEQTTEQAVVDESNTPSDQTENADAGAQDDGGDELEKLLSEFDGDTKPAPAAETPKAPEPSETSQFEERMQALENTQTQSQYSTDMADTVGKVRGDLDPSVFDDATLEGLIDGEARREPKIAQAWTNRHQDPATFGKVVAGLQKRFAKKFSAMPDQNATEDREAVSDAVRGASTKTTAAPEPDYSKMSDNEYRDAVSKQYGFDPV